MALRPPLRWAGEAGICMEPTVNQDLEDYAWHDQETRQGASESSLCDLG
jgi:hypothetical protein